MIVLQITTEDIELQIKFPRILDKNERIPKIKVVKIGEHRFWRLDNWI